MHDPPRKWKSRSLVRSFVRSLARLLARGEESDESTVAGAFATANRYALSLSLLFLFNPLPVSPSQSRDDRDFPFPRLPYAERFSLADSPPFALPKALAVLFDRPLMFY